MLKKILITATALAVSAPALADHGRKYGHYNHYRPVQHHHVVYRPAYYAPAPVIYAPVYYRPAPVVVYQPAPVVSYHAVSPVEGAAVIFGAVLGAAVVHHLVTGR